VTRFPRDRFDDVADGPRIGAHRGVARRGRGWIAFAWAALATGVLVGAGVLVLASLNGSVHFTDPGTSASASAGASSSASASASAGSGSSSGTSSGSDSSSGSSSGAADTAASPSDQTSAQTIVVLNGTTTTGLAASGQTKLTSAGWKVSSTGNAGTTGATGTIIYYQKAADEAVARGVAKSLGVGSVEQSSAFPNAAISVVLGADYTK
jgi:cytoskeletal protein RodZ